ncbi:bifunctional phosphopantothenoylcysteine decarboxylase/phosphopantothenate--cysteine ligase CoaBC [Pleionea sp. CnH1-48]|uniref:bifunctional phosphopantothenoylcysteine decarboxylase/phosphopantothenate--cysteine ligase CoaBC n=1 Tax=Pleionea sp. CnH1-48 TaxID=2954494 RepID=UPI002098307B|nr:bifunctional phosphopantothenoylcysteine decarboxylase/phosphopantothenate--cysteine ligase CoaBC [Pleionea sp. CnH1-48]MCO7224447.1 bifunctional phosphopantothenoylcysteine decarboxylase/phosphopantothenate--cysteine ligase CoaBC [Pleionea sp. CnH1-48]
MLTKRIILGVTGGIAAYKSVELCRRLIEKGCEVRVVMTAGAKEFITPMTFQAVSGHPVHHELFDEAAEAAMGHIELARWADQILIAPASADFMARIVAGMAGDLLSTLCLASNAPVTVAPAMNQQMWRAAATQHNIDILRQRNIAIIGPASGEQACGDIGPGRMVEPLDIANQILDTVESSALLAGQRWVITAGPTRESIDPVRFLSNHSSGKMGYSIAEAAAALGAEVELVSGPVNLPTPHKVERQCVTGAQDMLDEVMKRVKKADVFVACAAVADYRIKQVAEQKIKKNEDTMTLELVKNPDILQLVSALEQRPLCVGFAAETQDVEKFAQGKLKRKKLDLICANNVSQEGVGFDADDNALMLLFKNGDKVSLKRDSKQRIAAQLVQHINELLK